MDSYPIKFQEVVFVAVTKLLATVLECQMLNIAIKNIDNTLSMDMYKDGSFVNNWQAFFADIDPQKAQAFALPDLLILLIFLQLQILMETI